MKLSWRSVPWHGCHTKTLWEWEDQPGCCLDAELILAAACSPGFLLEASLRFHWCAGAPCPWCLEGPAGVSLCWGRTVYFGGATSLGTGKCKWGQIATHGVGWQHCWYALWAENLKAKLLWEIISCHSQQAPWHIIPSEAGICLTSRNKSTLEAMEWELGSPFHVISAGIRALPFPSSRVCTLDWKHIWNDTSALTCSLPCPGFAGVKKSWRKVRRFVSTWVTL